MLRRTLTLAVAAILVIAGCSQDDAATRVRQTARSQQRGGVHETLKLIPILLLALAMTGCGVESFDVTTTVISHESTQEISVWAPEGEGPWPIAIAIHGADLSRNDLAATAEGLASRGVVVFAADWQPQSIEQDLECATRYALSVAADYGGDVAQPFTFIGHSAGAIAGVEGGLNETAYGPDGTYQACFTGRPMPDVIVAISGCYYESEGQSYPFGISRYSNNDADLVLVAGTEDQICEPWQSQDAAETLRAGGYSVDLVEIQDANHNTVIYHDCEGRPAGAPSFCVEGDERLTLPDDPAGNQVVESIFDSIQAAQE